MKTWIPLLDPLGGLIVLEKSWHQTLLPSKSNELMRDNFYRILHYLHVPKIPQYVLFGIFFAAENEYCIFYRREINRQKPEVCVWDKPVSWTVH